VTGEHEGSRAATLLAAAAAAAGAGVILVVATVLTRQALVATPGNTYDPGLVLGAAAAASIAAAAWGFICSQRQRPLWPSVVGLVGAILLAVVGALGVFVLPALYDVFRCGVGPMGPPPSNCNGKRSPTRRSRSPRPLPSSPCCP